MQFEAPEPPKLPVFHVLPECVPVHAMWMAVHTQWRWASDGLGARRVGLCYPGVRATPAFVAMRSAKRREEMLSDLCIMESAWLAEDARQRAYRASAARQQPLPV